MVLLLIWHSAVTVHCNCIVAVLLTATELVEDHGVAPMPPKSVAASSQMREKMWADVWWLVHMVAQLHNLLHNQLLVNTAQQV